MIESLFRSESTRQPHRDAPFSDGRERYIAHLAQQGFSLDRLRHIARTLVCIVELLALNEARTISLHEIAAASELWAAEDRFDVIRRGSQTGAAGFRRRAAAWFRFLDILEGRKAAYPFQKHLEIFINTTREERGLASNTLRGYGERLRGFLIWYGRRGDDVKSMKVTDVDDYLQAKREENCKPRTITSICLALRLFFSFAESRGWCRVGISRSIHGPRTEKITEKPKGPPWSVVRKLIRPRPKETRYGHKTRAIYALCAIYGMRASEVARLALDDLDWVNETISISKSKRRGYQQFPLQYEVGEAIIAYLRHMRPQCTCRNLFVTHQQPHRPMSPSVLWRMFSNRMKSLGIESECRGPHALRHSCATELLKRGSSLREIADFLGHRGLQSVSIYAKYDVRGLKAVSRFSLGGVL